MGGRYKSGTKAGAISKTGHRVVCFKGKYYPESNVVWAIHYGKWPESHISYLNGDLQDNRPENLYESSVGKNKKISRNEISIERLKFLFSYKDGNIIRNVAKPPNTKRGDVAGTLNDSGYLLVNVDGNSIRVHKIIWAIHYNEWPKLEIDHINGIRSDNRIENLRLASHSENAQNSFVRCTSRTGIKGVRLRDDTGKYHAYIQINKKIIDLGCYDKIKDAVSARKQAEIKYHPYRKLT